MQKNEVSKSKHTAPQQAKGKGISLSRNSDDKGHYSVTIGLLPEAVYSFYRDFENLPKFMKDLKSIKILSQKKSHWVVEIKGGLKAEWDAEITAERPNEMIAWKSTEGSEIETSGAIFFYAAPANRGTVVSLSLDYKLPGGKLTELLTSLAGDNPADLAFINLRRMKAYLETGVIPTIEGQPSGREPGAQTIN